MAINRRRGAQTPEETAPEKKVLIAINLQIPAKVSFEAIFAAQALTNLEDGQHLFANPQAFPAAFSLSATRMARFGPF
jgi:hypothetical protein